MKLYIPNDDPRLAGEYVEIKEDRSAYAYAASLLGLFGLAAGMVALVLFW